MAGQIFPTVRVNVAISGLASRVRKKSLFVWWQVKGTALSSCCLHNGLVYVRCLVDTHTHHTHAPRCEDQTSSFVDFLSSMANSCIFLAAGSLQFVTHVHPGLGYSLTGYPYCDCALVLVSALSCRHCGRYVF